jgi:electron transfer flavoprotein beta subunit
MNILVLVKQVPDISIIKIDPVTNTLIRSGVPSIINPDDLAGVEEALKLKEQYGGKVTVLTMGPAQAEQMIYSLYARGVDEGYLLTDRKFAGSDTWATSHILSSMIKTLAYDLIIAGYQAIDGDTAQVGPQVAEFLELPQITHVSSIKEIKDGKLICEKRYEEETHLLAVEMPCLITTTKSMNTPRLMKAHLAMDIEEKKVNIINLNDIEIDTSEVGLQGSPTRVKKTYTKEVIKKSSPIEITPREAAMKILSLIK